MTFLKNYTSNVPVHKTIYRIEQVLIRCGVVGIHKEYLGTNGTIGAVTFQIASPMGKLSIRIPADQEKALDALWLNYVGTDKLTPDGQLDRWSSKKRKVKKDFTEQAA